MLWKPQTTRKLICLKNEDSDASFAIGTKKKIFFFFSTDGCYKKLLDCKRMIKSNNYDVFRILGWGVQEWSNQSRIGDAGVGVGGRLMTLNTMTHIVPLSLRNGTHMWLSLGAQNKKKWQVRQLRSSRDSSKTMPHDSSNTMTHIVSLSLGKVPIQLRGCQ